MQHASGPSSCVEEESLVQLAQNVRRVLPAATVGPSPPPQGSKECQLWKHCCGQARHTTAVSHLSVPLTLWLNRQPHGQPPPAAHHALCCLVCLHG